MAGQPDGALTVTFALYPDQQSLSALWSETQTVQVKQGKYTALLGSTSSTGLPSDSFSADQARWLGVQVNGVETRHLLVSVPYAMKAVEAERLGGLLPSQLVTVQQLQAALTNSATGSSTTSGTPVKAAGVTSLASGNPPQPATDFTDNNASEVLLVTQQGTGFAVHAISAGDAALFAENSNATGTVLKAVANSPTGANIGILGQSASPNGIAGVFDNTGGGQILSLRNNGNQVLGVNQNGGITTLGSVFAFSFIGDGSGLLNIPNSATSATTASIPNTIVLRDNSGGITGNAIVANNYFAGSGLGLFNIPNSATTATTANTANTIVLRDNSGAINANGITASFISGNGAGLFNIPNSATTATPTAVPNTIVQRDNGGVISVNGLLAGTISGNGGGLFNIPNSATTATPSFTPNTIVSRDASGSFSAMSITTNSLNMFAGGLTNSGYTDFSAGSQTSPVHAVLAANTPGGCNPSKELLIKTDATPGQQLFICNASGNGWVLLGDGSAAGVTSVVAGDGSITVGGATSAPTVSVANGGITSAKLASGVVVGNIADGSLTPSKINGTAATLGANTFTGTQTMPAVNAGSLSVSGNITGTGGGSISGSTFIQSNGSTALSVLGGDANNPGFTAQNPANSGIALQGTSIGTNAIGVLGRATGGQSVAGLFVNTQGNGRIISAGTGSGTFGSEVFSVDTAGNMFVGGSLVASFPGSTSTTTPAGLAKLDVNGFAVSTAPGDTAGAVGVVLPLGGTTSSVRIAYGGTAFCVFDSLPHIRDYVQISSTTTGECADVGPNYPTSGQVIGRVTGVAGGTGGFVLLSGPSTQAINMGVGMINTGAGLIGGPITSSGTIGIANAGVTNSMLQNSSVNILAGAGLAGGGNVALGGTNTLSIANAGITNSMLQNSAVTVTPGAGLSGGGAVPLGGSVTLNNTGALSFNGRTGNVFAAPGDYSFGQIGGTLTATQLPPSVAYTNQPNVFGTDQVIGGALSTNSLTNATSLTTNSLTSTSASIAGAVNSATPLVSITENGPATPSGTGLFVASTHNVAATFFGSAPTILQVGTLTNEVLAVTPTGMNVFGSVSAQSFSGDGSALTNVNATSIGGTALANLATASALASETTARQAGDASLTTSIAAETTARQSGETTLQNNINSEASARQSAVTGLQSTMASDVSVLTGNLNSEISTRQAEDNFLQTTINSETTARQQDVSNLQTSIGNVSAADAKLASANTFTASNTFTAGTQDFSGAGATLPVRALLTPQTPATCVAGKELLIKIDAPAGQQLFLCDVSGTTWDLVGGGVTAFNGRSGSVSPSSGDYSFSQISGSLGTSQLPANIVYTNQANTFSASQAVNGTVTATSFSGNGSGLSNVNAATLNNLSSASLAQLGASSNTFAGSVTASAFSGAGSGLTNVNAATVNNLQMLKLTASITPASVTNQTCSEQSFTVSGVNAGDVLLSAQITTHSPGTNIAIGGSRVSAANTVAIQFCNVSRSSSTPAAGTYTFALMR